MSSVRRARPTGLAWGDVALAVCGATTAAAMIATPLQRRGRRAGSAVAVVSGLAGWVLVAGARRWGPGRATATLGVVAAATTALEKVGTTTGVPFGAYRYTDELRPQVTGVPATVPLAWFAMAVPSREAARAVLGPGARGGPLARAALGSALLTAWDLFLDPQMTREDYWRWERSGRYRGIPASNYLGWFVSGLGVVAAVDRLLPAEEERPDPALVGAYAWMAVMSTLGFAAFFRDPVVAAAGGVAMLPAAVVAARRTARWPT